MVYNEMNLLIEKYFEGTTTLEEERRLKNYFEGAAVDSRLVEYRPLFQYLSLQQDIQLDEQFDTKIINLIQTESKQKPGLRTLNTWVLRVAAAVVLALGVWWFMPGETENPSQEISSIDWSQHEPETAEEALMILRTALSKTSKKLNEGASVAAGEVTKISEIGKYLK